jgi:hypothetical protein
MELTSQQVYPTNPIQARKRIVHIYQQTQNYCKTARRCHTSPQRVRQWVKRDQQYGAQALHNLPKTQKRQPRKPTPTQSSVCCNSTKKPTTDANASPATSPNTAFTSPPTPSDTS